MNHIQHSAIPSRQDKAEKLHKARMALARRYLSRLDSASIEAIAEAAICELDGRIDPDEDQCEAGDDGCGTFCAGDRGIHWGSADEGASEWAPHVEYGEDQREIIGRFGFRHRID